MSARSSAVDDTVNTLMHWHTNTLRSTKPTATCALVSEARGATSVGRVAPRARAVDDDANRAGHWLRRTMELRWRSIIESAVDGIVVIDAHGHIDAFNPAAERLFGYTEPEVVGRNVSMLMPSPYRDEHDSYLERYLREGDARIIGIGSDVQGVRRDGTVFPLPLSVGEMSFEGQRKFTGFCTTCRHACISRSSSARAKRDGDPSSSRQLTPSSSSTEAAASRRSIPQLSGCSGTPARGHRSERIHVDALAVP